MSGTRIYLLIPLLVLLHSSLNSYYYGLHGVMATGVVSLTARGPIILDIVHVTFYQFFVDMYDSRIFRHP
ncbi:uncharacterized protein BJ212DRAFT_881221 [Suillus subaureus]|uniref:Uncharacterized protein n=1 Tax=Suillus subaureus TaxID=48587 RepID=A0A9P7AMJ0_9AGAM|nr:uncharacterized protein BJ212DRAFT_881221 [Suillus subaureus]KAG1791795.1 hypothetical protein BJ212DRAFT_881221 [Suillus subaureus]